MDDRRGRFEAQVLAHLDAAYRFARWLCRSPGDADDVVQDAVLRAWRSFEALRGTDARAWLLAIVRNCHRTALARHERRASVPLPEEHDPRLAAAASATGADPEHAAIAGDAGRALERLLAALPEEHREVLVLREVEELSYREIAAVAGVPIGTVMSRLARARAAFRTQWSQQHPGESREVR
ncbi:MAG TPA: sigma-70 family RNA polymerase sigma factor [Steroidobacteraceae bacterium]|nr:sigma-70 family RNA polymerase sigma factor [Steroidobacteraceae bacterium]